MLRLNFEEIERFNALLAGMSGRSVTLPDGCVLQQFSWHFNRQLPGLVIPEHEHANFELTFVLVGGMVTSCDGCHVNSGGVSPRFLLIPPGTLHRRVFLADEETINFTCVFSLERPDGAVEYHSRIAELCRTAGYCFDFLPVQLALRDELIRQLRGNRPGEMEIAASLLQTFLLLFTQHAFAGIFSAKEYLPVLPTDNRHKVDIVRRHLFVSMADEDICRNLAMGFGMSMRNLNRIFRAETGMSVNRFRSNLRLEHARNLLAGTAMPISEIGRNVGFKTAAAFHLFFKQHCHCSPSAFRDANQGKHQWR